MSPSKVHTQVTQQRVRTTARNATTTVTTDGSAEEVTTRAGGQVTQVVLLGRPGPKGDKGDASTVPGPQGPAGPAGPPGGGSYVHTQNAAAAVWTITHNLGFRPGGITVEDSAGTEIVGDRDDPDANTTVLTFDFATGGVAYLS